MISRAFYFIYIFGIATTFRIGTSSNRIVNHFIYIPRNVNEMENGNEDVQWEFFVIGKRVPWNEAQSICPIYGDLNLLPASEEQEMGYGFLPDLLTHGTETDIGSTLAVFDEDTKDWLARMLSESNYRYDGLWIGGQRKDFINWTWTDTRKKGDMSILNSLIIKDYPAWHIMDNHKNDEKNCLMFDRINHETPVLVPDICQYRKPFICMRSAIESVWLDGRCIDGIDMGFTGFMLLSKKSNFISTLSHPILSSLKNYDFYQEERCLILDRHLCAKHTTPVFIDLDCRKKRPFVCQNASPEIMKDDERDIFIDNRRLIFSSDKMTWNEGEVYCQRKSGRIANILDAKTLFIVLKKMIELGERNLYFVENYEGLAEMNSALNSTRWTEDYAAQCEEIQWIIPEDNKMLAHLLNSKK